ncbi:MAG TPA: choice-of-anchor tandem repeat GloVer-containing protein [Bryobacteraceae bacterium]|nr:choice-of-anchor tandem repeat GloVer-containing protein [Bryobacteraceae bacterium]
MNDTRVSKDGRIQRASLRAGILSLGAVAALFAQPAPPALRTIYNFGSETNGGGPLTLVAGRGGVLYGTSGSGGSAGIGSVYSLTPPASAGAWTESLLYSYTGPNFISELNALVVGDGVLYGVNTAGGLGFGEVYSLAPPAEPGGTWVYTALYDFTGSPNGASPTALVVNDGVLYGLALGGFSNGAGAVYSLTPPASAGDAWTENVLYNFSPAYGANFAGLAVGEGGVLYGINSGAPGQVDGIAYSLTPPQTAGGAWTFNAIYRFVRGGGPYHPDSLRVGSGGVLYGSSRAGGTGTGGDCDASGCGTIFSLTPPMESGGDWTATVLYSFDLGPGALPGGIAIGAGGTIYGSSYIGGGAVFSVTPPMDPGAAWTEAVLYQFPPNGDGGSVPGNVVIGAGGALYGTTGIGGTNGAGTVFQLRP